jgi:hypothetical protein
MFKWVGGEKRREILPQRIWKILVGVTCLWFHCGSSSVIQILGCKVRIIRCNTRVYIIVPLHFIAWWWLFNGRAETCSLTNFYWNIYWRLLWWTILWRLMITCVLYDSNSIEIINTHLSCTATKWNTETKFFCRISIELFNFSLL